MKFRQLLKKQKEQKKKEDYKINLYCERCTTNKVFMMPTKLPYDKELKEKIKIIDKKMARMPLKMFKKLYVYFECPVCKWYKFVSLQQLIKEAYIHVPTCKDCKDEVCHWINCSYGGYVKEKDIYGGITKLD